jgi:hypothetical protein
MVETLDDRKAAFRRFRITGEAKKRNARLRLFFTFLRQQASQGVLAPGGLGKTSEVPQFLRIYAQIS